MLNYSVTTVTQLELLLLNLVQCEVIKYLVCFVHFSSSIPVTYLHLFPINQTLCVSDKCMSHQKLNLSSISIVFWQKNITKSQYVEKYKQLQRCIQSENDIRIHILDLGTSWKSLKTKLCKISFDEALQQKYFKMV